MCAADRSIVAHARRSKKILAAATVMDGSGLPTIDALPVASLSTKHPRAAGYRAAISSAGTEREFVGTVRAGPQPGEKR